MASATGDTDLAKQQPVLLTAQRVGGDLRAARERLGWSLAETSAYVRIRPKLLAALEEGRIGDLPGPVYAVGFVRSYAIALGVDAEEMVRRYHAEVGGALPKAELCFPTPMPQRHVPPGAVVMLGALLALVGYASWYRASGNRAELVPVQTVPARLAPLALPVVPARPGRVAAEAVPSLSVASAYVPPAVPPSAAEAAVPAPGSLIPIEPAPIAAAPGSAPHTDHVVLGATADAWVQIKDGQGKIVLSKLLHAGDSWPVPDQPLDGPPMMLTTGNAGGTVLTLDGQALPALGGPGVVRRDVPLDPGGLRSARAGG